MRSINYSYIKNGEEKTIDSLTQLKYLLETGVLSGEDELFDKDNGSSVRVSDILESLPKDKQEEEHNSERKHKQKKRTFKSYIIPGVLILIGLFTALLNSALKYPSDQFNSNQAFVFGYRLGAVFSQLIIIVILWSVAWAITKTRKVNGPLVISIIYLIISIIVFSNNSFNHIETSKQNNLVNQKIYTMVENATKGLPITDEVFKEEDYGKQYQLLNTMRDMFKESFQITAEIQDSIKEAQISTILTSQVLGDQKELSMARERLKTAMNKIDDLGKEFINNMDTFVSKVNKLDLSEEYKQGIIDGYLNSSGNSKETMRNYYQIEMDIFASIDDILEYMQSKEGTYTFNSSAIIFENDADAEEYNKLYQNLEQDVAKETEWLKKRNESLGSRLNEFKDELK